jgi:hypothetical protein
VELPSFKPGCAVGNKKSKVHHDSGGSGYEKAQKSANAVLFKSAADAEKADYTRSKR